MIAIVCLCRHSVVQGEMARGQVMCGIADRRVASVGIRDSAFHRDGHKRLNRQGQRQQHDDEEFAPIGHGFEPSPSAVRRAKIRYVV